MISSFFCGSEAGIVRTDAPVYIRERGAGETRAQKETRARRVWRGATKCYTQKQKCQFRLGELTTLEWPRPFALPDAPSSADVCCATSHFYHPGAAAETQSLRAKISKVQRVCCSSCSVRLHQKERKKEKYCFTTCVSLEDL